MNGQILISIVLPFYNAEKTIKKTIESIVSQLTGRSELILVDDGSEDGTLGIIDSIQKEHKNISLIQSMHRGVSYSRNLGIKNAKGEYVTFIDADDFYEETALEQYESLIEKYSEADLLITDFYKIIQGIRYPVYEKVDSFSDLNNFMRTGLESKRKDKIFINYIFGSVWRCCFKKDFLLNNSLFFDEKLRLNEDQIFLMQAISKAMIHHESVYLYNYCWNSESAVNEKYKTSLLQTRAVCIDHYFAFYRNDRITKRSLYRWIYKFAYEIFRNEAVNKKYKDMCTLIEGETFRRMNSRTARWYAFLDLDVKKLAVLTFISTKLGRVIVKRKYNDYGN